MPGPPQPELPDRIPQAQDGSRARLYEAAGAGAIQGFIHPYLATRDERLPLPLDLVPRDAVVRYPTDFARMAPDSLHLIATRGEQLTISSSSATALSWGQA